jgi:hypothetical protein
VTRERFQFVPERFEAIMAAVLSQPLTAAQRKQAQAIPALLPVEARLGVRSWGWEPCSVQESRPSLQEQAKRAST